MAVDVAVRKAPEVGEGSEGGAGVGGQVGEVAVVQGFEEEEGEA